MSKMTTDPTWIEGVGHRALRSPSALRARLRFAHATLTAAVSVPRSRRAEVRRETSEQLWRSGVRQLPMVALIGLALGLLVVGQAVALLQQVNARHYMGTVMVTVVMRELGPLLTVFLLAARVGMATVVELSAVQTGGQADHVGEIGMRALRQLGRAAIPGAGGGDVLPDDLFDRHRAGQSATWWRFCRACRCPSRRIAGNWPTRCTGWISCWWD